MLLPCPPVHASPMSGRKYVFGASRERITLEKQWHTGELAYPLQTVVADIYVHDSAGNQYKTTEASYSYPSLNNKVCRLSSEVNF